MSNFSIQELMKVFPILLKESMSPQDEEEDEGYESPSDELDVEEDVKENFRMFARNLLPDAKLSKLSSYGNLIRGVFQGGAIDRLLFGSPRCRNCENKISFKDPFYRCFECKSHFFCFKCYPLLINRKLSLYHPNEEKEEDDDKLIHLHNGTSFFHPVRKPDSDSRQKIRNCHSSVEALLTILKCYSPRFFLGKYITTTTKHDDHQQKKREEYVKWITYREIYYLLIHGSTGFEDIMLKKRRSSGRVVIGLLSELRFESILIDFISIYLGCTFIPIQRTIEYNEKKYVIEHSEVEFLFVSSQYLNESLKLQQEGENINNKKFKIISFDDDDDNNNNIITLSKIISHGRKKDIIPPIISKEEDIMTIIYTSGSTGVPKGVVFTEKAWKKEIMCLELPMNMNYLGFPLCSITYSPYSHYTGRIFIYHLFANGGRVSLCEDISKLFRCIEIVRPIQFSCVPRILTFIKNEFQKRVNMKLIKEKKKDEEEEEEEETEGEEQEQEEEKEKKLKKKRIIQTEVMKNMKNFLGDRLRMIITFGAPLSTKLKKQIRMMLKCAILDSYGMTEFGGVSVNFKAVKGVNKNFKIIDCPAKGYYGTDKPYPRGEICVKRKEGIIGYFKNKEATKTKWGDDGYFRTGDIAEIREGNNIVIIDRISNVVKLSQGEFVSLEKIENLLSTSSELCDDVFVYSKPTSNNLVALVVISKQYLNNEKHIFLKDLKEIGKRNQLRSFEIPVDIFLVKEHFSIDNGLLTSTGKKKRKSILKKYGDTLSELLEQSESTLKFLYSLLNNEEKEENKECGDLTFFQLGGDSISALFFINEMSKRGKIIRFDDLVNKPVYQVIEEAKDVDKNILSKTMIEEKNEVVSKIKEIQKKNKNVKDLSSSTTIKTKKITTNNNSNITIFMTGGSGFLGMFLIKELLEQFDEVRIICLVRKQSKEKFKKSVEMLLLVDDEGVRKGKKKIEIVEGDLSKNLLGMESEEVFNRISNSIDCIVHNGAYVNHLFSYDDLYKVNVRSIFDIIRLSRGKVRILYVSSVAVYLHEQFGNDRPTNDILSLGDIQNRFYGYGSTKWVVDQSLRETCPDQVVTFRPALIGWSGQKEENNNIINIKKSSPLKVLNESDWLIIFLKAMIRYRKMPEIDMRLDLLSADFVAYSMIRTLKLSLDPEKKIGRVFDLSMDNISMNQIFETIQEYFSSTSSNDLQKCSVDEFLEVAKKNKEREIVSFSRFLRLNFEFFLEGQREKEQKLEKKKNNKKFNPEFLEIFENDERFLEEINEEKMVERMKMAVLMLCKKMGSEDSALTSIK